MTPTARQITAARALLGWTAQDLADAAGCSRSTIADYERDLRTPGADSIAKMVTALEIAGVRFIPHGVHVDPTKRVAAGVRAVMDRQAGR